MPDARRRAWSRCCGARSARASRSSTDFEPDLPPTRVDPNQLELALLNLALNARDAMPLGGRLTISAHRELIAAGEVPGLAPGEYVCIAERDTGDGMDEATLKRATEPFFTTKGAGRGTGLGCRWSTASSRNRAARCASPASSAWARMSSSGCRYRDEPRSVELRAPGGASSDRGDPPAAGCWWSTTTRSSLAGTVAMLEDLGHVATDVASGDAALQVLQSADDFDLVITDHAMPGMTGTELASRIRRTLAGVADRHRHRLRRAAGRRRSRIAAPVEALSPAGLGRDAGARWSATGAGRRRAPR